MGSLWGEAQLRAKKVVRSKSTVREAENQIRAKLAPTQSAKGAGTEVWQVPREANKRILSQETR